MDAGISARAIKKYLESIDSSVTRIMGIFVTHNHHDHIAGLQTLTRKYRIPVFSSDTVWKNILKMKSQEGIRLECVRKIEPEKPVELFGLKVEAFRVSHDTPETLGYHIVCGTRKITVVTDFGHICPQAAKYIKAANFLVIESNYDKDMLFNGHYPPALKSRIHGNNGHLDNAVGATFLAKHRNKDLSHICLAHLSKDNNTPEIALLTMQTILYEASLPNTDIPEVYVLERSSPSEVMVL